MEQDYASPTMACSVVGDVLVAVHAEANPTDADWAAYLDACRTLQVTNQAIRVLVITYGGTPTSTQRSALNELNKQATDPTRVAVMVDSRITRGAVTALSWFNPEVRAFGLKQLGDACAHLGVPSEEGRVRAVVQGLEARMGNDERA